MDNTVPKEARKILSSTSDSLKSLEFFTMVLAERIKVEEAYLIGLTKIQGQLNFIKAGDPLAFEYSAFKVDVSQRSNHSSFLIESIKEDLAEIGLMFQSSTDKVKETETFFREADKNYRGRLQMLDRSKEKLSQNSREVEELCLAYSLMDGEVTNDILKLKDKKTLVRLKLNESINTKNELSEQYKIQMQEVDMLIIEQNEQMQKAYDNTVNVFNSIKRDTYDTVRKLLIYELNQIKNIQYDINDIFKQIEQHQFTPFQVETISHKTNTHKKLKFQSFFTQYVEDIIKKAEIEREKEEAEIQLQQQLNQQQQQLEQSEKNQTDGFFPSTTTTVIPATEAFTLHNQEKVVEINKEQQISDQIISNQEENKKQKCYQQRIDSLETLSQEERRNIQKYFQLAILEGKNELHLLKDKNISETCNYLVQKVLKEQGDCIDLDPFNTDITLYLNELNLRTNDNKQKYINLLQEKILNAKIQAESSEKANLDQAKLKDLTQNDNISQQKNSLESINPSVVEEQKQKEIESLNNYGIKSRGQDNISEQEVRRQNEEVHQDHSQENLNQENCFAENNQNLLLYESEDTSQQIIIKEQSAYKLIDDAIINQSEQEKSSKNHNIIETQNFLSDKIEVEGSDNLDIKLDEEATNKINDKEEQEQKGGIIKQEEIGNQIVQNNFIPENNEPFIESTQISSQQEDQNLKYNKSENMNERNQQDELIKEESETTIKDQNKTSSTSEQHMLEQYFAQNQQEIQKDNHLESEQQDTKIEVVEPKQMKDDEEQELPPCYLSFESVQNQCIFLIFLENFRQSGKSEVNSNQCNQLVGECFRYMKVLEEIKDVYQIMKYMPLTLAIYKLGNSDNQDEKVFIQDRVKNHTVWTCIDLWESMIFLQISDELLKLDSSISNDESVYKNTVYANISAIALNMLKFRQTKAQTKNIVARLALSYGLTQSQISDLIQFIENIGASENPLTFVKTSNVPQPKPNISKGRVIVFGAQPVQSQNTNQSQVDSGAAKQKSPQVEIKNGNQSGVRFQSAITPSAQKNNTSATTAKNTFSSQFASSSQSNQQSQQVSSQLPQEQKQWQLAWDKPNTPQQAACSPVLSNHSTSSQTSSSSTSSQTIVPISLNDNTAGKQQQQAKSNYQHIPYIPPNQQSNLFVKSVPVQSNVQQISTLKQPPEVIGGHKVYQPQVVPGMPSSRQSFCNSQFSLPQQQQQSQFRSQQYQPQQTTNQPKQQQSSSLYGESQSINQSNSSSQQLIFNSSLQSSQSSQQNVLTNNSQQQYQQQQQQQQQIIGNDPTKKQVGKWNKLFGIKDPQK